MDPCLTRSSVCSVNKLRANALSSYRDKYYLIQSLSNEFSSCSKKTRFQHKDFYSRGNYVF